MDTRVTKMAARDLGDEVHPLPSTLGEWITELRLAKRKVSSPGGAAGRERQVVRSWARADLAVRAAVSEPTLFRIETGTEFPRFDILEAILSALDVFPWQAQLLRDMWLARTTSSTQDRTLDDERVRQAALQLLEEIPFPAFVFDGLYYVKARNRYISTVVGLTPDDSELWENPNSILVTFHPSQSVNWFEPDAIAVAWRLQQFLLDTARSCTDPAYGPLLLQLEEILNRYHRGWHTFLHLGELPDPPGQRALYRHPEFGPLEFLVLDQRLKLGHTHKIRVYVPTASSSERYQKVREAADRNLQPVYVSPAWRR